MRSIAKSACGFVLWAVVLGASPSAWAIDEAGVKALKPGSLLQVPVPNEQPIVISVSGVIDFISGGSHWYSVAGRANGEEETVFLDFTGPRPDASLVVQEFSLQDLKIRRQALEKFDQQGKGKVTLGGKDYVYEDSDDAQFIDNGKKDEVTYYEFSNKSDQTDSLLILQWDDDDIDGYRLKTVNPDAVKVVG